MKSVLEKYTINFLKKNKIKGVEPTQLSLDEKSIIISTILAGITPPSVVLEEVNDSYLLLSGNNIVNTILDFLRGNFEISKNDITELLNNTFINKSFFDFSECEKGFFLEQMIAVTIVRNLLESEKKAINILNSKSSNHYILDDSKENEISNYNDIDISLEEQLNHNFFKKVNAKVANDLIIQLLMISEKGAVSDFSAKKMLEFKSSMSNVSDLSQTFDYLDKSFNEKTTYLKRAHLPVIYVCANCAIKQNIAHNKFKEIMDSFYTQVTPEYRKACNSRSSAKSNVNVRLRELLNHYNNKIEEKK